MTEENANNIVTLPGDPKLPRANTASDFLRRQRATQATQLYLVTRKAWRDKFGDILVREREMAFIGVAHRRMIPLLVKRGELTRIEEVPADQLPVFFRPLGEIARRIRFAVAVGETALKKRGFLQTPESYVEEGLLEPFFVVAPDAPGNLSEQDGVDDVTTTDPKPPEDAADLSVVEVVEPDEPNEAEVVEASASNELEVPTAAGEDDVEPTVDESESVEMIDEAESVEFDFQPDEPDEPDQRPRKKRGRHRKNKNL